MYIIILHTLTWCAICYTSSRITYIFCTYIHEFPCSLFFSLLLRVYALLSDSFLTLISYSTSTHTTHSITYHYCLAFVYYRIINYETTYFNYHIFSFSEIMSSGFMNNGGGIPVTPSSSLAPGSQQQASSNLDQEMEGVQTISNTTSDPSSNPMLFTSTNHHTNDMMSSGGQQIIDPMMQPVNQYSIEHPIGKKKNEFNLYHLSKITPNNSKTYFRQPFTSYRIHRADILVYNLLLRVE